MYAMKRQIQLNATPPNSKQVLASTLPINIADTFSIRHRDSFCFVSIRKYYAKFHVALISPFRNCKSAGKNSCCIHNTKYYSKQWIIHLTALPSVTMRCKFIIDSDNNINLNTVGSLTYELRSQLESMTRRLSKFLVKFNKKKKTIIRMFLNSIGK